jgi:predicted GTPase
VPGSPIGQDERIGRHSIVILGAGGRDFHDFNVVYRDDPEVQVVAFTAAQIPGIADRRYPPSLAGPLYPAGIPIVDESALSGLIADNDVDEVVLAYSDLSHVEVMHKASLALAAGADFRLLGPERTMIEATVPVIAVCAVRTGCGKSQTSRWIGRLLVERGVRVALVRHPMPYGDLAAMRVQRFATMDDIDAADPTIEEREEYEPAVRAGMVVFAGVDYQAILRAAEDEADVIVWDGGNNDAPFYRPDLMITVVDPLRPGDELSHHPGEVNLRLADVVVVNKIDAARPEDVGTVLAGVESVNPTATVVRAASPVTLAPGPSLVGRRVLVVEDGPTITHGGMAYGAGLIAAREAGAAEVVDPRPFAVGSIVSTFDRYPHIGPVLPAVGYGSDQLAELAETIDRADCDVVVSGTPADLGRLIEVARPVRHATYDYVEIGEPSLSGVLAPMVERWKTTGR